MAFYDFTVRGINGEPVALAAFRGKVCLIVNVASACGYTPQYAGLEALYRRHQEAGLMVMGFPCNQFGHQEPGEEAAIQEFCRSSYGVTFPLFAKIEVNGPGADPLFRYLKSERPGLLGTPSIKWNFTKFLVDRQGAVATRYGPGGAPAAIEPEIVRLLA